MLDCLEVDMKILNTDMETTGSNDYREISGDNGDTNVLQTQNPRVDQEKVPCIRVNTRELDRELFTGLSTFYTKGTWSMLCTPSLP